MSSGKNCGGKNLNHQLQPLSRIWFNTLKFYSAEESSSSSEEFRENVSTLFMLYENECFFYWAFGGSIWRL
jgi:hypothetical protein